MSRQDSSAVTPSSFVREQYLCGFFATYSQPLDELPVLNHKSSSVHSVLSPVLSHEHGVHKVGTEVGLAVRSGKGRGVGSAVGDRVGVSVAVGDRVGGSVGAILGTWEYVGWRVGSAAMLTSSMDDDKEFAV